MKTLIMGLGKGMMVGGKLMGKGVWLLLKGLLFVLTLGVLWWLRHRREKRERERHEQLMAREQALEQRIDAMAAKEAEPGATPVAAAEPAPAPAEAAPAPPPAPPVTQ